MKKLITYFIKYPITGNVLMVLILVFGVMGMASLRKTFFPENESTLIMVDAVYPGASPSEIEKTVILKIEENIDGITGIEQVTSTSSENVGKVIIEVDSKFEIQIVLQDVKNAIDRINSFPSSLEPPSVYIKENVSFAISYSLSGDVPLHVLKDEAEMVESDLKLLEGISKVTVAGYPEEEIEIAFRQDDLKKYNLSFDRVNAAIARENIDLTGGKIKTNNEELRIRGNNKVYQAEELAEIIVANQGGRLIRLKDVATVEQKWVDAPDRKYFNESPAVVIKVDNTIHEDIGLIVEEVTEYMEVFNQEHDVLKADLIRDGSKVVEERIELLGNNGLIGFILVFVFLSMFLHPSLAGWVAAAIPISFAGMFILASFYGISLNVISLFGMIIVIGILVDDGIVIAENIYQHHERGKDPIQAAYDGTMEVLPAVFSAVMTTVVAFSLFFMLDGRMGDFFPEMGFVVIATLIFSLIEGAFILPAHIAHSKALSGKKTNKVSQTIIDYSTKFLDWNRKKIYQPMLRYTMKNPFHIVLITVGLMVITISGIQSGLIKVTVFPSIEGDNLNVTLRMQPGTSEKVTKKWIDYIEENIEAVNEEISTEFQNGDEVIVGIEKTTGPAIESASMNLILMPIEQRNVTSAEMTKRIKERVGEIPGADFLSYEAKTPFGKAVSIALFSKDAIELEQATERLQQGMDLTGKLKNIENSNKKGTKEIHVELKDKAFALGFTSFEIMNEIRKGYFGLEVQRLQKGMDEVRVWLRYREDERTSISQLENEVIRLHGGEYRLTDLVDLEVKRGIVSIEHLDGKRSLKVSADLLNPHIDSPVAVIGSLEKGVLVDIQRDFPSVKYSLEGQIKEQSKTGASAKIVGPIVLILMLTIIVYTFRSFLQTAAVVLMLPFGLIGVGWGHFIHDAQMSMFSYFGMIALIGIMVNDALVFITTFNQNLKKGLTFKDAIWETGNSRFRPIVLTSLTTIAGLAPLIAETSFQAQFLIPMAIAIAYGLAIVTLLTLVYLPALLILFNKFRKVKEWLITGKVLNEEDREPAVKEIEFENIDIN